MIKKFKKIAVTAMTLAMIGTSSLTAFAASSSTAATGYGTLYGSLSKTGYYVTSVTKNNDNAKLTISGTIQDVNGRTVATQQIIYSDRNLHKLLSFFFIIRCYTTSIDKRK